MKIAYFKLFWIMLFLFLLLAIANRLREIFRPVQKLQEQETARNDLRYKTAVEYFNIVTPKEIQGLFQKFQPKHKGTVDIAIAILTVPRHYHNPKTKQEYRPHYFVQAVSRLFSLLQKQQNVDFKYSLTISICNSASRNIRSHDYNHHQSIINRLQNYLTVFNIAKEQKTSKDNFKENLYDLSKQKYASCMEHTLNKWNPKYLLILEDDVLVHDDFFQVLGYTVQYYLEKHPEGITYTNFSNQEISCIKFHHPNHLLGYLGLERERIPELIGLSSLLATIFTYCYIKRVHTEASHREIKKIWMILLTYFIVILLLVERSTVQQFRYLFSPYLYSMTPAPSCCTQANLYTSKFARNLVHHLKEVRCSAKFGYDSAIEIFSLSKGFKMYLLQPNSVTHIGMYSSLTPSHVNDPRNL